jgi:hypothetical protein
MRLNHLFQRPTADADAESARAFLMLARFAVLGAIVLGVLPATPEALGLAQSRKAGADVSAPGAGGKGGSGGPAVPARAEAGKPVKISTAPFKPFLARARKLVDEGKLDLSKRQAITVEGDRQEDGTLANAVFSGESSSNPHMRRTAQDFVGALNESRVLHPLEGVTRVSMTFTLDGDKFTAHTVSETPSEARAEEMARGYRVMLNVAKLMRRGTSEAPVISGMKVSSSGKQLLMNLDTTREAMGNLLLKQITPN